MGDRASASPFAFECERYGTSTSSIIIERYEHVSTSASASASWSNYKWRHQEKKSMVGSAHLGLSLGVANVRVQLPRKCRVIYNQWWLGMNCPNQWLCGIQARHI